MNLHSIRFSSVFFTFLLLCKKVCAFSSAFLYVHIRTNQIVTYCTKVVPKNFFVKGYKRTSQFWNIALIVYTQSFWTKFLSICNSLLSADMDLQKCGWKSANFLTEKPKRKKKRTKNGYRVNSSLNATRVVTSLAIGTWKSNFFRLSSCFKTAF